MNEPWRRTLQRYSEHDISPVAGRRANGITYRAGKLSGSRVTDSVLRENSEHPERYSETC